MWQRKEVSTNRVLFYYILAIVLPCIGLGILAFRGILNDQALLERENQRRIQEVVDDLSSTMILYFDSIEQTFISLSKPENILGDVFYFNDELAVYSENNSMLKVYLLLY